MSTSKKRRLGRGLGALIDEADSSPSVPVGEEAVAAEAGGHALETALPVASIKPNRYQPRHTFRPEAISELAASILAQGLIQPIVVNRNPDGSYELISGERRLRAVRQLGWTEVPALIRSVSPAELLEMTLVENLQREDLDPIEEAQGYRCLIEDFGQTQAQVAEKVGKDRVTVANALRLLKLPEALRKSVSEGELSAGHARALLALDDPALQLELARRVVVQELSVRKLEALVRELVSGVGKPAGAKPAEQPSGHAAQVQDLESRLRSRLGTRVHIRDGRDGKGRIEIEFFSYEEFERLLELLDVSLD
ncbi:ParB/RepB/Spo0J family partition protein [bacterium]|nr:ParB/RepB/Spo0J family partition protein [bacterium]